MKKALAVGAVLGVASAADAAVFNVTNNGDAGAGSLRQAILDANSSAGADTITFDAAVTGTISLTTGEMLISDEVEIVGPGSANLTIDANEASRVFYVYNPSPAPVEVTISGLTLTNGLSVVAADPLASAGGAIRVVGENCSLADVNITNSTAGGDGGAVAFFGIDSTSAYNPVSSVLSIQNSVLSGNTAEFIDLQVPVDQGGCGGGVWAASVYNILLDNVTLVSNGARCDGGGLHATYFQEGGAVTIQNSVITGNTAGLGESGNGGGVSLVNYAGDAGTTAGISNTTIAGNEADGYGGGIVTSYLEQLTIVRTTISGNTAAEGGGGAAISYGAADIVNSTVAVNQAGAYGGGIYAFYANLTVEETTISGNTASEDGPGIYAYADSRVDIENSIVADNTLGADLVDDVESSFGVAYSLIENQGSAQIDDGGGNLFGVDPQLGPLQNNGGPTLTVKPAVTSPAINAGDPGFTPPPSTDQRDFARIVNGRIDMGAVELDPGVLQFSVAAQAVSEEAGVATVTLTRTGGTDGAVSVQVTLDGSSTATGGGIDHTFAGTTVNFPDNDATPQNFNITIVNDPDVEPSETIVLTLGSAVGAAIGAPATHTVTILDSDVAPPPSADLSITKVLQPGPLTVGSNATFIITVTNSGPDAAANVAVTDTLPPQLTFVSATPSQGTCDTGPVTITCTLGALGASGSATITLVATLDEPGATTNTASVTSELPDGDGTDNTAQATFTVGPGDFAAVPALDPRMQLLLAALVGAVALAMIKR